MEQNPKQIVAEKIRTGASVLVTVSKDPTVDQLASALGLSLMLNALGKHTTTVFSGQVPSTVEFLRPEETFDSTVDGLRDFIISLDKEKADKLRYKVEDDIVKIFITPYKTKLSEKDLEFSQGDFNVDLVIALGVTKRDDLDEAITAHGRILHDATIVTINAGPGVASGLGAVDWSDPNASCLSEMLVSISEALQGGILDAAMSTAFLTGIVSETDRFKNEKTTPKLMTMAAQLMAAGANQQLIATNLQLDGSSPKTEPGEVHLRKKNNDPKPKEDPKKDESENTESDEPKNDAPHDDSSNNDEPKEEPKKEEEHDAKPQPVIDETFDLEEAKRNIGDETNLEDIEKELHAKHGAPRPHLSDQDEDVAIQQLEEDILNDKSATLDDIEDRLDEATGKSEPQQPMMPSPFGPVPAPAPVPVPSPAPSRSDMIGDVKGQGPIMDNVNAPSLGGTFNATSEEAHNAIDAERQKGINKEVFSHNIEPTSGVDEARAAVDAAMGAAPYVPDNNPIQSIGAQEMPGDGQIHDDPAMFMPPMPQQAPVMPQQPMPQQMPPMPMQQPMPQQMPPMPQQPVMPQQPMQPNPQMYPMPPQQQYPSQNSGQVPPQMPPGGPPPMPQF